MPTQPLDFVLACALALAPADVAVGAAAAQDGAGPGEAERASGSMTPPATPRPAPRLVRIPDPVARRVTLSALDRAVARLEEAGCRRILLDFTDRDGRPLQDRWTSLRVDFDQYVGTLVFYDGTRSRICERGGMAFTAPASRVVHVCVDQVKQARSSRPELLTAVFIHEILHTLGLGEDPPSSRDITRRVFARCGREPGRSAR